jgi:ATP-dependent Clp protease ATP-binding subunit ClpA
VLKKVPHEHQPTQDMAYSLQLITSLGLAVQAAKLSEKGHHLRFEFLLLGLVRNKQCAAAQILEKLGVSLADVEKAARDVLDKA